MSSPRTRFMPADAGRSTLRRAGTLLAGSGGSQLIALGLAPLLTRLYDPHAFGALGMFTALTTLAASVASGGLENAIVIERDPEQSRIAFGLSLLLAAVCSCLTAALTWAAWRGGWLPEMPRAAVWLAGPSVLSLAAGNVLANRALSLERPAAVAAGRLLRGAGIGLAQTGLAAVSASGLSLIVGGLVGQLAALVVTAFLLGDTGSPRLGSVEERSALLRRHRTLLAWSSPQTLLNNLGNSAVPTMLGRAAGSAAVGAFTLANRVVMLPAITIGEAMRQSLLTSMSRIAHDDAALRQLTWRATVGLAVPLGAAAALAMIMGPAVFAVVFGPGWRAAGLDAGLLLAAQAAGMANIPSVTVITVRGWQRELFAFGAVTLPVRLAALWVALAGGATRGLAAWCALSALASIAVTAATLVRLRPPMPVFEEVSG